MDALANPTAAPHPIPGSGDAAPDVTADAEAAERGNVVGDLLPPRKYALTSGMRRTVAGDPELERDDEVAVAAVVVVACSALADEEAPPPRPDD